MSRTLPFRPSPEHLKNEARQLQKACHRGQTEATELLRHHLPRLAGQSGDAERHDSVTLQEAQLALARDYGFESWPKMMAFVKKAAGRLSFTDQSKKILGLGHAEAGRLRHQQVGTEHLLLGMLGDGARPFIGPLLEELGAQPDRIRGMVEELTPAAAPELTREIMFSPIVKIVLGYAADEARALDSKVVSFEHVLLGLLRDRDGVAAQVLGASGLRYGPVRDVLCGRSGAQEKTRRESAKSGLAGGDADTGTGKGCPPGGHTGKAPGGPAGS